MASTHINLTDVVRSVRLLRVNGYCMTKTMDSLDGCIKSRWNVYGYDWEIRLYTAGLPGHHSMYISWIWVELFFLGEARARNVKATLGCRLVDPRGKLKPSEETRRGGTFKNPQDSSSAFWLIEKSALERSAYLKDDSFTVQCTITVLKEIPDLPSISVRGIMEVPSSKLHEHLGELLRSGTGADVTFLVSGESFAAHKAILAARSPVLMAEFFGKMKERSSRDAEVKAMLHFVYTDTVPELADEKTELVTAMAQHLLAAAERYGLDRPKLICEGRLSCGISVDTAATTLALAEQHNCSLLKAKCLKFIVRTPATLDAVMATDGYQHLEASCPLVLRELLKSARGRKRG
ncbi:BTB/POZ and MATH domain-containing protein 1-like [Triticum dicoccoides]|uniref:BTB/POZ and MATH domain-containing protein 1-like n=1 Tax=Triticum dicoccoides TaxID=85692 RepID=UPI0018914CF7|nr:BTB/POZ and MATH domain-containing protein 1-like [Triticum dicoccoides]